MRSSKSVGGRGHYRRSLATYLPFICGSTFAVFLCLLVIFSIVGHSSASAESVGSSTFSVNIVPVITVRTLDSTATSEISSLDFNVAPTPNGVTYTDSTVVDVATSNVSGYSLYMNSNYEDSSSNKTTALINTDPTISVTIPTSTAATSDFWNYSGSWNETINSNPGSGSSATTLSGSTGTKVIPTYNTPDLLRDDVEDPVESSHTTVAISVNVDNDIPAGTYRNKLVFTAIANPIPVDYTLTFNKNTTDTVENLPSPITATSVATSYNFTIPDVSGSGTTPSGDPIPQMTRAGYQLVGWSESPTERQGSGSGPDGLYVAGDTYTVIADDPSQPDYSQHGVGSGTLYAVWVKTLWNITTMQEMTPEICASTTTPKPSATVADTDGSHAGDTSYVAQSTLSDIRDGNTYTVRKLADGNCWMTENLRLRLTAGQALTNANTDLNSRTSWTPTTTTQAGTTGVWGSAVAEHSYWDNSTLTDGDGYSQYIGTKYNWYTATAMSGNQATGASGSELAPDSVCPKGWKLPPMTSSYQDSFVDLFEAYGIASNPAAIVSTFGKFPFSYIYSGYYAADQGKPIGVSNFSQAWSSEAFSSERAYYFGRNKSANSGGVGADTPKSYGFSVRCIAR